VDISHSLLASVAHAELKPPWPHGEHPCAARCVRAVRTDAAPRAPDYATYRV